MSHRSGPGCSLSRKSLGNGGSTDIFLLPKMSEFRILPLSTSHTFILHYGKVSGVFKLCWSRLRNQNEANPQV